MNTQTAFPGRFILAADITLNSPMHITAIEKGRYVYEGVTHPKLMRFDAGPGVGIQCTLTHTMRLGNQSYEYKTEDGPRIKFGVDIPVIPASTIGGKLRRAACDLLFESLIQRDLFISTDAYNTYSSGSATTSLNADASTPEVIAMARKDAFLSNFGGTSFALASRSVIATGVPLIQMTSDMLMSPPLLDPLGIDRLDDLTSTVAIVRKDSVWDARGKHVHEVIRLDDFAAYFEDKASESAQASQNKASMKAAKATGQVVEKEKKRDLRTLGALEAVNSGVSFALRIQVDATTPAQLGLMVLALQSVLRDGQVGGKGARGFGQFVCEQSRLIRIDPTTNRPLTETGEGLFEPRSTGYAVVGIDDDNDSSTLAAAVDAAKEYIENIQPELMEAVAKTDAKSIKDIYKAALQPEGAGQ